MTSTMAEAMDIVHAAFATSSENQLKQELADAKRFVASLRGELENQDCGHHIRMMELKTSYGHELDDLREQSRALASASSDEIDVMDLVFATANNKKLKKELADAQQRIASLLAEAKAQESEHHTQIEGLKTGHAAEMDSMRKQNFDLAQGLARAVNMNDDWRDDLRQFFDKAKSPSAELEALRNQCIGLEQNLQAANNKCEDWRKHCVNVRQLHANAEQQLTEKETKLTHYRETEAKLRLYLETAENHVTDLNATIEEKDAKITEQKELLDEANAIYNCTCAEMDEVCVPDEALGTRVEQLWTHPGWADEKWLHGPGEMFRVRAHLEAATAGNKDSEAKLVQLKNLFDGTKVALNSERAARIQAEGFTSHQALNKELRERLATAEKQLTVSKAHTTAKDAQIVELKNSLLRTAAERQCKDAEVEEQKALLDQAKDLLYRSTEEGKREKDAQNALVASLNKQIEARDTNLLDMTKELFKTKDALRDQNKQVLSLGRELSRQEDWIALKDEYMLTTHDALVIARGNEAFWKERCGERNIQISSLEDDSTSLRRELDKCKAEMQVKVEIDRLHAEGWDDVEDASEDDDAAQALNADDSDDAWDDAHKPCCDSKTHPWDYAVPSDAMRSEAVDWEADAAWDRVETEMPVSSEQLGSSTLSSSEDDAETASLDSESMSDASSDVGSSSEWDDDQIESKEEPMSA